MSDDPRRHQPGWGTPPPGGPPPPPPGGPPPPPPGGPPPPPPGGPPPWPPADPWSSPAGTGYVPAPGYAEPPAYAVPPPEGGALENAVKVVTAPVDTLRRLTHHPRVGWAVGVVLVVGFLSALAGAATFDTAPPEPFGPGPRLQAFRGALLVMGAILGPLFTLLFAVLWAAILHGMARILRGVGTFAGMFTGVSFAYVVTVLAVPFQLLPLALGGVGSVLAGLVGFGLFVWSLGLDVVAVRECHHLSTGRAVAAALVPIGVLFALGIVLVALIVALIVGGLAGTVGGF